MALLDWLLNRKNRTFEWVAGNGLQVVVDIDEPALCGATLGCPIDRLSCLGPCDEPRLETHCLKYYRHGFYVVEERGLLDLFVIFIHARSPPLLGRLLFGDLYLTSFGGLWRLNGREVAIGPNTSPADVRRLLGDPFHEYTDPRDGEIIFFFEQPQSECQFSWYEGRLDSIEFNRSRELAARSSRDKYDCTRPWPFPDSPKGP